MSLQKLYNNLSAVVVKCGVNIKQGDTLMINAPVDVAQFARLIAEQAYKAGCKQVVIHWNDQQISKLKYRYESEDQLKQVNKWMVETYTDYLDRPEDVCNISIIAEDPSLLKDIDSKRIGIGQKARKEAMKKYYEMAMSNEMRWCVISVPIESWAAQVFPGETNAFEKLTQNIMDVCLCNFETPEKCIEAWNSYNLKLSNRSSILNSKRYRMLKYSSVKTKTSLQIKLHPTGFWCGGPNNTVNQVPRTFNPNIPSYEIFSAPIKDGVDGIVYSSLPLVNNGKIVKNFWIRFENGVAVEYDAEENRDILAEIMETDEGAKRLGEVALVPIDSPIYQKGVLFLNTLFDENASCHLALGRAYEDCCDGTDRSWQNDSQQHVDFMIGSDDMSIVGVTEQGIEEPIFVNGKFVF